jgi:mannose-6-phosphate isomerase-like protein (cupin superfamily)
MIRKASEMANEVREQMRGGPGKVTFQHLFKKEEFGAKCRLCARLILPPGAGIGTHQHETEDEIFYILKGTALTDDGHSQTRLAAGDATLTGKGGAHSIKNIGNDDLEIMAIIMVY